LSELYRAEFGDTPLSADELQGLIPSLTTQRELNEIEFANIMSGRRWALSPRRLAKSNVLNVSYLLELHRHMFDATWRWAGKVRTTEKTIGVVPHQILSDLGALLGDAAYWVENASYPPDELALRFHHRLVSIHPFSNGNGQHSRLAADILALKIGRAVFPWGGTSPNNEARRKEYLAALRSADGQDYMPLIAFARGTGVNEVTQPSAAPASPA
jgi:Fic-DOC domain mobile mystery protein B